MSNTPRGALYEAALLPALPGGAGERAGPPIAPPLPDACALGAPAPDPSEPSLPAAEVSGGAPPRPDARARRARRASRPSRARRAMRCGRSSSRSEYITGIATSVSSSDRVWPPMITVLIAGFVAAPTQPVAARRHDRRVAAVPLRPELVRAIDLEDRVLLHDAEEHQDAELREDVERAVQREDRQQGKRHGQRQREQDRDRVEPRLELRRQHEVHEPERHDERLREGRRLPALLDRLPRERRVVRRAQSERADPAVELLEDRLL